MRLRTAVLSLIPGAAHVDLGRAGRGLLIFFLFAFSANAALVAPLLTGTGGVRTACALAAAGIWVAALYDAIRIAARMKRTPAPEGPSRTSSGAPDVETERPVGERSG